uniref:ArkC_4 n=1 Tax=Philodina roseola TaxID=96448 RepID=B2L3I4_PHIRO|nr:ArkC_4 [Philodina roseola]
MMKILQYSLLLLMVLWIVPSDGIRCYECGCALTELAECNCGATSDFDDGSYCFIAETRTLENTYIQMSRLLPDSTYIEIEDTYFVLVQESIRYNRTSATWSTVPFGVIFGCDWDLCNSFSYVSTLPYSFQLDVADKEWLTENIYGTGTVDSCRHCPTETCGNGTAPIGDANCPLQPCNASTTCVAYDYWNDLATDLQCYQSNCAEPYLQTPEADRVGGPYRLDVEAIVYLAQNRSDYDIWELDVYCGAPDCTRPTIFKEILSRLRGDLGDLSGFPSSRPETTTPPSTTTTPPVTNDLQCYSCECFDTSVCPCDKIELSELGYTYCIVVREVYGQSSTYTYLGHLNYYDTIIYIQEFPYALVEESIGYNERTGRWFTTTNYVIYGCNWNLCNKPDLIPLLPDSFQMRLPESWLNTSVLGTGQPVRDCHECPDDYQCGIIDFLDANKCPIQSCNTTCLVIDTFDDPEYDYLCYQSYCLPPDDEFFQYEQHRVEIEGVIYASDPTDVQIWEIDIFCRADDCSRPGIFKELREQLRVQPGTLSTLFNVTHDPNIPQRRCYNCYCYDNEPCNCQKVTMQPSNSTYCVIERLTFGQDVWVTFDHISQDSTRVFIRDFPYIVVEESIIYDDRFAFWSTYTNLVIFGCNWDLCNDPALLSAIPNTFQMRLPDQWLNTNVLGTGQPVRDCHECPDVPQCGSESFLDASRCPIKECNTTCLVFDTFNDPSKDEQCYQSFCAPPDTEEYQIDTHRVELEGILYLRKAPRTVELWEIDLYCRADDCSRPEIFTELRSQLSVVVGDLSVFDALLTTSVPTNPPGTTTTTNPPGTTPSKTTEIPSTTTSAADKVLNSVNKLFIMTLLTLIYLLF